MYSTDVAQCGDIVDTDGNALQLSGEGIFTEEFSCQFVGFKTDADKDTGRIFGVVATASCSDDSGISRPDLISMSPYEEGGQVIVQSQNEYLLGETEIIVAQQLEKPFPEKNSYAWVSNTYNLCK
ncbi:MAG: hypothetical protein QNJ29_08860 [Rhizobiaceae bacterium]|nr:hypothetical protein [Rhizobiaceae bacterium]